MTFAFKPAGQCESMRPLLIGLAGGTGSGKTYSALRLAHGLVGDEKVAAIDTENGRLLEYRGEFPNVLYSSFEPPYTPMRYHEAMQEASKVARCVIVDSVSHEWEGVGGLLEWANSIAERMANKAKDNGQNWASPEHYSFPSWKEPKAAHQRMVSWLISAPCHLILCFRAKEKKGFEEVEYTVRGKTQRRKEIVDLGWQPITEGGLPYEMSFLAILTASQPGVPQFTFKALSHTYNGIFGGQITEDQGAALARLVNGKHSGPAPAGSEAAADGSPATPTTTSPPRTSSGDAGLDLDHLKKKGAEMALQGTVALKQWGQSLSADERQAVTAYKTEWFEMAKEADRDNNILV